MITIPIIAIINRNIPTPIPSTVGVSIIEPLVDSPDVEAGVNDN